MRVKVNVKQMSFETGIPVLEIEKMLSRYYLLIDDIKNSNDALKLLDEFATDDDTCQKIISKWKEVSILEVKKETDFYKLKNLYELYPEDFEAKEKALAKINHILIQESERASSLNDLKTILLKADRSWSSYSIIEGKLEKAFNKKAETLSSIKEMKKIYFSCINVIDNKEFFFKKWNILCMKEMIKAKSLNHYIYVYNNSDSSLDSYQIVLDFLRVAALKELKNCNNTVFDFQEILEKLPLNYDLAPLFQKKIEWLIDQEVQEADTLSKCESLKSKYSDFPLAIKKIDERIEIVSEEILKQNNSKEDLVEVWYFSRQRVTQQNALKQIAKFYEL